MKNEIRLYGPIGGYGGYTAEEIMSQIPDDAKEVTLRIHSPGGSVGEGLAMYNALRDHPANIITVVDGYAASSASFLMLAGDERRIHKSSMVFVHNPWTYADGNASDLRKVADDLDKHTEAILAIYTERTGMDETELRKMMDDSIFMLGAEAQENGFANSLIEDEESNNAIAAMLDFDRMAAQLKGEAMTQVKPRKEVTAERDALAVKAEEQAANITALETTNKEVSAELETTKAELETTQENATEMQASIDILNEGVEAASKEIEVLKEKLETVTKALKRPETVDASVIAFEGEIPDQPNDELVKQDDSKDEQSVAEQYNAINDPRERMAFWREHSDEIINEMNKE